MGPQGKNSLNKDIIAEKDTYFGKLMTIVYGFIILEKPNAEIMKVLHAKIMNFTSNVELFEKMKGGI